MFTKIKKFISRSKNTTGEKAVFEIYRSFEMDDNTAVICGTVKSGKFRTGDKVMVCGIKRRKIKLEGIIKKITTALVEVNNISSGYETDILIEKTKDRKLLIFPGDRAYKVQ